MNDIGPRKINVILESDESANNPVEFSDPGFSNSPRVDLPKSKSLDEVISALGENSEQDPAEKSAVFLECEQKLSEAVEGKRRILEAADIEKGEIQRGHLIYRVEIGQFDISKLSKEEVAVFGKLLEKENREILEIWEEKFEKQMKLKKKNAKSLGAATAGFDENKIGKILQGRIELVSNIADKYIGQLQDWDFSEKRLPTWNSLLKKMKFDDIKNNDLAEGEVDYLNGMIEKNLERVKTVWKEKKDEWAAHKKMEDEKINAKIPSDWKERLEMAMGNIKMISRGDFEQNYGAENEPKFNFDYRQIIRESIGLLSGHKKKKLSSESKKKIQEVLNTANGINDNAQAKQFLIVDGKTYLVDRQTVPGVTGNNKDAHPVSRKELEKEEDSTIRENEKKIENSEMSFSELERSLVSLNESIEILSQINPALVKILEKEREVIKGKIEKAETENPKVGEILKNARELSDGREDELTANKADLEKDSKRSDESEIGEKMQKNPESDPMIRKSKEELTQARTYFIEDFIQKINKYKKINKGLAIKSDVAERMRQDGDLPHFKAMYLKEFESYFQALSDFQEKSGLKQEKREIILEKEREQLLSQMNEILGENSNDRMPTDILTETIVEFFGKKSEDVLRKQDPPEEKKEAKSDESELVSVREIKGSLEGTVKKFVETRRYLFNKEGVHSEFGSWSSEKIAKRLVSDFVHDNPGCDRTLLVLSGAKIEIDLDSLHITEVGSDNAEAKKRLEISQKLSELRYGFEGKRENSEKAIKSLRQELAGIVEKDKLDLYGKWLVIRDKNYDKARAEFATKKKLEALISRYVDVLGAEKAKPLEKESLAFWSVRVMEELFS